MKTKTGICVYGKTPLDNQKIKDLIDHDFIDLYAEYDENKDCWFFPEDEDTLDKLDAIIYSTLTDEYGININTEPINESLKSSLKIKSLFENEEDDEEVENIEDIETADIDNEEDYGNDIDSEKVEEPSSEDDEIYNDDESEVEEPEELEFGGDEDKEVFDLEDIDGNYNEESDNLDYGTRARTIEIEDNEESEMVKQQLRNILRNAQSLLDAVDNEEIEPWMLSKITLAKEYVEDVNSYIIDK